MDTYRVKFELTYPESKNDIRTAYVLAKSFNDAILKVEQRYKKQYESAGVLEVEVLEADIIV